MEKTLHDLPAGVDPSLLGDFLARLYIELAFGLPNSRKPLKQDIAIVIPCYRVRDSILSVVRSALEHADLVICVDDACPENSGRLVQSEFNDSRVRVVFNERNLGVGGAVKAGYREALTSGRAVVVKLDGDGQMDANLIPVLVQPILAGESDYCKGNRFHEVHYLKGMPALRVFGNSVLSLFTKLSSGYWQIFDPTNGYTAIDAQVLAALDLDRISDGYFFESDMLFRLNVSRAVVTDVPMSARYGDEVSNLRIGRVVGPFLLGNFRNLGKRILYSYFLRDFNIASLQLVLGSVLFLFGFVTGVVAWSGSIQTGIPTSAGTVMLAGLPIILGFQLLLSFLNFDIQNQPRQPLARFRRREVGN